MHIRLVRNLVRISLLSAVLATAQACVAALPSQENGVSEAYRTANVIAVAPYTRTIFSSNNF